MMAGTFAGKGGDSVGDDLDRLREGLEGFSEGVKGEGSKGGRFERGPKEFLR